MSKQTETMRIAYNWAERNKVQVLHYGSRQWETGNDEDEALAQACTGLQTPGIVLPTHDYPHRDVLSPGPNKLNPPNMLSTAVVLIALELVAGLIWMWLR